MKKPKILIGIPTMSSVHPLVMMMVVSWMSEAYMTGKFDLSIYPTLNVQPVDNARNEIVKVFLESGCTHLFFIDSDTIPPIDAIHRLLAHDLPIVSGLTPIIEMTKDGKPWRKWNCVDENDKHMLPNTGVNQCKGAGGSCLMIKREVFEAMKEPYFRFVYQDDNGKNVVVGEDVYFIVNALSLGIKTYADTTLLCQHYKPFLF